VVELCEWIICAGRILKLSILCFSQNKTQIEGDALVQKSKYTPEAKSDIVETSYH
jgi:hypothetical protein